MSYHYIVTLVFFAGCCHSHAITLKGDDKTLTFSERIINILEKKCLKNADQVEYKEVLQQLEHLKNDCFVLAVGPEGISSEELTSRCHARTEHVTQCLTTFGEKLEPCLDAKEKYLQQFIVDVYNSSKEEFCDHIKVLSTDELLQSNTAKCIITLQEHPEINPHVVCHENSTVIGNNPTVDIITKEELCSTVMETSDCYYDLLTKHCPESPEVERFQRLLVIAVMQNCMDVLFHGTTEIYTTEIVEE